jgi:hypothetical protein
VRAERPRAPKRRTTVENIQDKNSTRMKKKSDVKRRGSSDRTPAPVSSAKPSDNLRDPIAGLDSRPNGRRRRWGSGLSRRARIRQLELQVADLERRQNLKQPMELATWFAMPACERDAWAARAYIDTWGARGRALRRLGFDVDALSDAKRSELEGLVFSASALAKRDELIAEADAVRKVILARNLNTALHGSAESCLRAAELLIKVRGWDRGTPG